MRYVHATLVIAVVALLATVVTLASQPQGSADGRARSFEIVRSDGEWKQLLTPQQYYVLRQKGTERAFSGAHHDRHDQGTYTCAGCGQALFRSKEKYDSGTGWPSFWAPVASSAVVTAPDPGFFTTRTEVLCSRCGGHLGHVFEDGPKPTGLRYCMNSAALEFVPKGR